MACWSLKRPDACSIVCLSCESGHVVLGPYSVLKAVSIVQDIFSPIAPFSFVDCLSTARIRHQLSIQSKRLEPGIPRRKYGRLLTPALLDSP